MDFRSFLQPGLIKFSECNSFFSIPIKSTKTLRVLVTQLPSKSTHLNMCDMAVHVSPYNISGFNIGSPSPPPIRQDTTTAAIQRSINRTHLGFPLKRRCTCTRHLETSRLFLRGTCGGQGDVSGSYLRIRDLGEHGGQTLRQQHCSPAPQQELRQAYRLIPNHSLPSFSLQPPCPLFLSSFSACTCAVYRTGPQWPWVINSDYGDEVFLLSTVMSICCLYVTPEQEPKSTGSHQCSQLKTAPLEWREPALQLGYIN